MHTTTAVFQRLQYRRIILRVLLATAVIPLFLAPDARADSQRCPGATVTGATATAAESTEIQSLWRDLGDGNSSDGPLGCPIGDAFAVSDAGFGGVGQKFQRGWILIGRGTSNGVEVAAVRGLNGWIVWWKGLEFGLIAAGVAPTNIDKTEAPTANATWAHGGYFQATETLDRVALWQCRPVTCAATTGAFHWERVTPMLDGLSRPFDAAARLGINGLSTPDANRFQARVDAVFPNWIGCYAVPEWNLKPGEDEFDRLELMLRRRTPCPIAGGIPHDAVLNWLKMVSFPDDQEPGSSSDSSPCKRDGELDVAMAQLLHIIYKHQPEFDAPTKTHLQDILQKWGGKPRSDPYVTPDGTCLGFGIIETENHVLLQESDRYLINQFLASRHLGSDYDNSANRDWLLRFMQQLARRDFYEFNAIPYTRYQVKALLALSDNASDAPVATAATGLLHWLFAKAAISGNLDRDHRPYRRRPEPDRYANVAWWGSATTATTAELGLVVGPLEHVHEDIDLQFDSGKDDSGDLAFNDILVYPELGAAGENFLAELVDIGESNYRLPSALVGWLDLRYNNDLANRAMYVEALHHIPKTPDDRSLFAQSNDGVELVSGNRNWTMVAGGVPVAPGDPGPPPEGAGSSFGYGAGGLVVGAGVGAGIGAAVGGPVGAAVGGIIGGVAGLIGGVVAPAAIAANKQHDTLWGDQIAMMRETTLIPTAIGLNRSQTLRFGEPEKTAEGQTQYARMCVADGFMCGFDLHMPSHPFAVKSISDCPPLQQSLPNVLDAIVKAPALPGLAPLSSFLRCPIPGGGYQKEWAIWAYEFGTMSIALGDLPGPARIEFAWIEADVNGKNRKLHIHWVLPGRSHNWYNAHVYNRAVAPTSGDAPGDDVQFQTSGNPNNSDDTSEKGDAVFPIDGVQDPTWDILVEACDPKYGFLGIRTGHTCHVDVLPKLTVNVAPPPKQAFSCDSMVDNQVRESQSVVMDVGDCKAGPYGFFVYIWTHSCPPSANLNRSLKGSPQCPDGATNYGFAVVAPSRGWKMDDFSGAVDAGMMAFLTGGNDYLAGGQTATVAVPTSPAVQKDPSGKWLAVPGATPGQHTVTFRWPTPAQASITSDTAYPSLYGPIAADWKNWPAAVGRLSLPDVPGIAAGSPFIHGSGDGCIAISGLPFPSNPNPTGLVIDLRNATAPSVNEVAGTVASTACP